LAGLSRIGVNISARIAAAGSTKQLNRTIETLLVGAVVGPINAELARHDEAVAALDRAIAVTAA
jgi:hypothetical protein